MPNGLLGAVRTVHEQHLSLALRKNQGRLYIKQKTELKIRHERPVTKKPDTISRMAGGRKESGQAVKTPATARESGDGQHEVNA